MKPSPEFNVWWADWSDPYVGTVESRIEQMAGWHAWRGCCEMLAAKVQELANQAVHVEAMTKLDDLAEFIRRQDDRPARRP